jgi:serine/threonine-protein kinase
MATVHIGRMSGAAGFARTVAIKRLHPHLAADATFLGMFVDEARLAARIRHPNVIDTLDVVCEGGELFIVMEFVLGETLAKLVKAATARSICLPPPVVASIVIGALEGLHAAHEATGDRGELLGIVHRDISPQNILVARDGVPRVLDFGVAKAAGRIQETEGNEIKGKLAYMAPEQVTRSEIDRTCDIFAMGIVLWEALTSKRLFASDDAASTLYAVLNQPVLAPSTIVPALPPALDDVVLRALERDRSKRFATAQEMAIALEEACAPAPARHVGKWVDELAGEMVSRRENAVKAIESAGATTLGPLDMIAQPEDASHPSALVGSGSGSQRITSSGRMLPPESWRYIGYGVPVGQSGGPGISSVSGVSDASHMSRHSSTGVGSMSTPNAAPPPWMPSWMAAMVPSGVQPSHFIAAVAGALGFFALLVTVGLVLGLKAMNAKPKDDHPPASVVSAPPPPLPSPPAPPTPRAAESAAAPTRTAASVEGAAEPSSEPAAAASSVAAVPSATTPTATTTAAAPRPTVVAPKSGKGATPPGCDNPFTIDANGVKRPKPQCFGH